MSLKCFRSEPADKNVVRVLGGSSSIMLSLKDVFELLSAGWLSVFFAFLLGILLLKHVLSGRDLCLPPGPKGLPLVGYVSVFTKEPHKKLRELSRKYGDVTSFKFCGTDFVHLGSAEAIREAFVTQGNEFAGRQEVILSADLPIFTLGIVPSEGETWKINRRFALHTLRDFGFGKHALEVRVQLISKDLLEEMEESKGDPMDVQDILIKATTNVICSMLFDKTFSAKDEKFQKILKVLHSFMDILPASVVFINGVSFMKYLPLKLLPGVKVMDKLMKDLEDVIYELIREHQETLEPTFLRDFVDVFLNEMEKNKSKDEKNTFTDKHLMAVSADLFFAGTETSSTTLYWALRLLMIHPEIQQKIQSEIDEAIGSERLPSMADRLKLPYTEATINEVLRFSSILPMSLFHCNPEEVKFRNFTIPKRSVIVPNLWAAHHDPKYWPEPEKFDPTRFLGLDGKLEKRDSFFPFSVGKRACLGETLARMELFLFFACILQRFTVEFPPGEQDRSLNVKDAFISGLKPYKLCARRR